MLCYAPSVKIVLRLRPRKGEGRVRSRSTCETLVIGQFFRRARDFPPNAEKKILCPQQPVQKSPEKLTFQYFDCKLRSFFQTVVFIFSF